MTLALQQGFPLSFEIHKVNFRTFTSSLYAPTINLYAVRLYVAYIFRFSSNLRMVGTSVHLTDHTTCTIGHHSTVRMSAPANASGSFLLRPASLDGSQSASPFLHIESAKLEPLTSSIMLTKQYPSVSSFSEASRIFIHIYLIMQMENWRTLGHTRHV